jgi:8-oxo-dGTP diphosphatase
VRIVPVAGVAAVDGTGRILLVRRTDGDWTHPAGHVEPGESWRQAAEREFAEETGGRVHLHGILGVYSDPATQVYQYPSGERVHFVGVAFRGTATSIGTPDGTETTEVGWFDHDRLPEPLFEPARPIIADALDGTSQRSASGFDR